jgi:hypothetical protein
MSIKLLLIGISFTLILFIITFNLNNSSINVLAQQNSSSIITANSISNSDSRNFIIEGTIAAETPSTDLINKSKTHILSGNWDLTVINGSAKSFDSRFNMVHTDGTTRHTIYLLNFTADKNQPQISLTPTGNRTISGKLDIASNGVPTWLDIPTTININKLNTITIDFKETKTLNHFGGDSVYGIVNNIFHPLNEILQPLPLL